MRHALFGLFVACSKLTPLPDDVCGNLIVEPHLGEACDDGGNTGLCTTSANSTDGCKLACLEEPAPDYVQVISVEGLERYCPAGFVCGNGICRTPSGTFSRAGETNLEMSEVALADVTGDRQDDLVALTGAAISVFAGASRDKPFEAPVKTTAPPSSGLPLVVDYDRNGFADIVVPSSGGVLLMAGQPDGTFESQLEYASLELPLLESDFNKVRVVTAGGAPRRGAMVATTVAGRGVVITPRAEASLECAAPVGVAISSLSVDPDGGLVVAVASQGPNSYFCAARQQPSGWVVLTPTAIPVGARLGDGPVGFLGDRGCPDLILPRGIVTDGILRFVAGSGCRYDTGMTDAAVVWVEQPMASGVLSELSPGYSVITRAAVYSDAAIAPLPQANNRLWARAVVGDVTGDGLADIVASRGDDDGSSSPADDLIVLRAVTGGSFAPQIVDTVYPILQHIIDDFDGDNVGDIGIVEDLGETRVSILFGGDLETVVVQTPLSGSADDGSPLRWFMASERFAQGAYSASNDGISDLLLGRTDGAFFQLFGTAGRRMTSPAWFTDGVAPEVSAIAVGQLVGEHASEYWQDMMPLFLDDARAPSMVVWEGQEGQVGNAAYVSQFSPAKLIGVPGPARIVRAVALTTEQGPWVAAFSPRNQLLLVGPHADSPVCDWNTLEAFTRINAVHAEHQQLWVSGFSIDVSDLTAQEQPRTVIYSVSASCAAPTVARDFWSESGLACGAATKIGDALYALCSDGRKVNLWDVTIPNSPRDTTYGLTGTVEGLEKGDVNGDGLEDLVVLISEAEAMSARVLIQCENPAPTTQECF